MTLCQPSIKRGARCNACKSLLCRNECCTLSFKVSCAAIPRLNRISHAELRIYRYPCQFSGSPFPFCLSKICHTNRSNNGLTFFGHFTLPLPHHEWVINHYDCAWLLNTSRYHLATNVGWANLHNGATTTTLPIECCLVWHGLSDITLRLWTY